MIQIADTICFDKVHTFESSFYETNMHNLTLT